MYAKIITICTKTDLHLAKSFIQCTHNEYIFYIHFLYKQANKKYSPHPMLVLWPDKLEYYIIYPHHQYLFAFVNIIPRFCNIWNFRSTMVENLKSANYIIRAYERKYKLKCVHGINLIKNNMIGIIDTYLNTYGETDNNLYQPLNQDINLNKLIY